MRRALALLCALVVVNIPNVYATAHDRTEPAPGIAALRERVAARRADRGVSRHLVEPQRVRVRQRDLCELAGNCPKPEPTTVATRSVQSTAYCLTGSTANGGRPYSGSVAMNDVPMGSRWRVVETGQTYTVNDRIGHGSSFDIAMPGRCTDALNYGRRSLTVERVE